MSPALAPLLVTMGDPAGCGPQITGKAWQTLRAEPDSTFAVIGAEKVFQPFCRTRKITSLSEAHQTFSDALPVLEIAPDLPAVTPGEPSAQTAPAIITAIETGTRLVQTGEASALVTNPINKAFLYTSGFPHPGHTEFIASLCEEMTGTSISPVMMLVGGGLRVSLATIHLPLIEAAAALSGDLLINTAITTHNGLQRDFGLSNPKIAFTGLNPHAGESGAIGTEEVEIINPAADALRSRGIDISDARPADTVFAEALGGAYDAVIAMTHDQGLIPVKTLDFWGGVNTTLGLPIIRTSPDHGTAYEAARAGACREDSLLAAIRLAFTNADNRHQAEAQSDG